MTELITALDYSNEADALETVRRIGDSGTWYKVGKELFTAAGPSVVRKLKEMGKKVFLDLKFHDIPNTVSKAVRSAAAIGADLCNVHASGGRAMLTAAAEAANDAGIRLVAVTVLTSMDAAELASIGIDATPQEQVLRLRRLDERGIPEFRRPGGSIVMHFGKQTILEKLVKALAHTGLFDHLASPPVGEAASE